MEIDQGNGENLINSLSAQAKISKSHDIANMKLKYEEKLEEKNQRIMKLEKKNSMYLDIIAEKEAETSMIRSEDANSEHHQEIKRSIENCMQQLQQMATKEEERQKQQEEDGE